MDLASKHGFKREAYSIALGEEIPPPAKRKRGRPKKKTAEYRLGLALGLARAAGKTQADVAHKLAEDELGRRVETRLAVKKKKRQIENDISRLSDLQKAVAAFVVRSIESGISFSEIADKLDAAWAGNAQVVEEIQGSRRHN